MIIECSRLPWARNTPERSLAQMGKSSHPYSTEIQRSDSHQGILRRHRLSNLLPHWALEREQELVSEQGQVLEMGLGLDVVGLALVVVLVAVPPHRCNQSF